MVASGALFATFDPTGTPRTASLEEVKTAVGTPALQSAMAAQASAAAANVANVTTTVNAAIAGARAETASAVAQLRQAAGFISDEIARAQSGEAVINGRVDTLTSTVGGNTAAITSEIATRASADSALGVRIDTVTATTGTNTTAISSEVVARASADSALGGRIDTVTATAGANTTAIISEVVARTSADTALGGRIDSLTATVGSNTAAISSEATARASGDSALSSSITSLSATVGSNTASITTQAGAISTLQGRAAAFWQVTAVAGGRAQLTVYADANGGAGADIVGDLSIHGNLLVDGTVNTAELATNAVTKIIATDGGTVYVNAGTLRSSPYNGASATISSPTGSPIRIDASLAGYLADGWPVEYYMRLVRVQGGTTTTILDWFTSPIPVRDFFIDVPSAGSAVQYVAQFANEQDGTHGQLCVSSQKICLLEVKR